MTGGECIMLSKTELIQMKNNRLGEENFNNQGNLMRIVSYNSYADVVVEFQDEYKAKIHTSYYMFSIGNVRNPYHPNVYGVGAIGNKYKIRKDGKQIKEYEAWHSMLCRSFDEKYKIKEPTYQGVTCCKEWLLFENFYEWIHSQENFDKWLNGKQWALDKDILVKGNKIYSPETCCLVPQNVNQLFFKRATSTHPTGVHNNTQGFQAQCGNPFTGKYEPLGTYKTIEEASYAYKTYKEDIIKQVAQIEYDNGNITEQCYKAMMGYEVDILNRGV